MPKIRTDELPINKRNPMLYRGTISAFELRTGQASGEPNISITIETPIGKKFTRINLKKRFFEDDFSPTELKHGTKEFNVFGMSFGYRGRPGMVQDFLGEDTELDLTTPEELAARLNETAVGQSWWCLETQQIDKATQEPTQNYNIRFYREMPKRLPADTRLIEDLGTAA